jgi:hypothetical protein
MCRGEGAQIEIGPESTRSSKTALRPAGIAGTGPGDKVGTLIRPPDIVRSERTGAQIGLNNREGPPFSMPVSSLICHSPKHCFELRPARFCGEKAILAAYSQEDK